MSVSRMDKHPSAETRQRLIEAQKKRREAEKLAKQSATKE